MWDLCANSVIEQNCSLSSCHETSRRFLRYGNSFPSTFPEVLLAHASPNDWPIVAKHANMTSSRQYKCDARDNYIRIFYFTLNSWWLQYVRSARDQSNHWIITFTASPAWAWPTPRRRWTSPTADIARTYRPACSGLAAMWFAAYSGWGSLPPACRWWAPPLLAAGAPSCRAAEPNGRLIPRFPSPRTVSAPLPISRDSYPLATRRAMRPCPSRPRRRRIGRDRSPSS